MNKPKNAIDFPRINTNTDLQIFIEEVNKVMIPLVPEIYNFGIKPELKVGFQKVSVNLDKDAYLVDGGKYSLHLHKLLEIAQAAGLIITDSKEIKREKDANNRATLIKHQVTWEMKSIDGSVKRGTVTGEYNYEEDCARFIYKADEYKNGKLIAKAGEQKTAQINKRRTFGGALAESNAISRAISKALTKLPQSFTKDELTRPFLVPCVITDFSDLLKQHPELEKAYIAQQLGIIQANPLQNLDNSQNQITDGAKQNIGVKPEENEEQKKNIEDAKVIEDAEKSKDNRPPGMDDAEYYHYLAGTFRDSKQKERTEKIELLVKQKAYKRTNPQKKIEEYSVDKQIELIENLLNMPDAK